MNFFEQQDHARQKTTRLVILFVVAVVLVIASVDVAVLFLSRQVLDRRHRVLFDDNDPAQLAEHDTQILLLSSGITLLIIVGGTVYKTMLLSGGGPSVARMLGGRPIDPGSTDKAEQRVRNVIEEMSIASGVPVPQIFLLDSEPAINAFAAGWGPDDAAIGVTRGAVDKLTRDELQGVMGHEFSHLLNGDARLNLRLIGVLNGIMVISLIGYMLLNSLRFARFSNRRNDKGNGGAIVAMLFLGIALYIIGSVGVFFGRLIQAAVSRQRERLADSSAVQFTRNPLGLAGALKKIAVDGSQLQTPHAMEAAHLFFGNAFRFSLTQLLSTHPPLEERIRLLDPTWDGKIAVGAGATQMLDEASPSNRGQMLASMLSETMSHPVSAPEQLSQSAGAMSPQRLTFAAGLMSALPNELISAAREPFSARAVLFALLLNAEPDVQASQFRMIQQGVEPACLQRVPKLAQLINTLPTGARLPLLDIALGALHSISPQQASAVRQIAARMIQADRRVTIFEYTFNRLIEKRLPSENQDARTPVEYYGLDGVKRETVVVLAALAGASTADTDAAFVAGITSLYPENPPGRVPVNSLSQFDEALKRLARSTPGVKQRLIEAALRTIAADSQINVDEAELLRATAATLDIPLPPNFMAPPDAP